MSISFFFPSNYKKTLKGNCFALCPGLALTSCLRSGLYFFGAKRQNCIGALCGAKTAHVFPLIPSKIASGAELQCFSVTCGLCVYLKPFTWTGLRAEDSVNRADRQRDEARIWHLQSQVLRTTAGLRSADTSSQTHIKVSDSPVQRVSPSLWAPGAPSARSPGCPPLCLRPLPVHSHSTLSALYTEQRGCDFCPPSQPRVWKLNLPAGCFLFLWPLMHLAGSRPSQMVSLSPVHRGKKGERKKKPWVCRLCAESKQVQPSRLHKSWRNNVIQDFIGLVCLATSLLFSAAQPAKAAHTL